MNKDNLNKDQRAIIVAIDGNSEFRTFLLSNGLSIGTVFVMNYSPNFSQLTNITVHGKMLCLRTTDFEKLDWVRI